MKTAAIYSRVSSTTDRQDTTRQVVDLQRYAVNNGYSVAEDAIFEEHISGAASNDKREVLNSALDYCLSHKVDVLLISELSRLGRNVWEVNENVKRCIDAGLNVYFQKEAFQLFTPDGKVNPFTAIFVAVLGTCAQLERENIAYRLNSGRRQYIDRGGKLGRKTGTAETTEAFLAKHNDVVAKLRKGLSIRDCAKVCGVSAATVQKVKKAITL